MGKVDLDKFIASLCKKKIDYGLRAVINEALDEQSLRFDGNDLVELQSNAINILPNGIDIDSMMPNFEDRDWVVGFHTKISDVAKEFYRKGLEDMLQAIRKKG